MRPLFLGAIFVSLAAAQVADYSQPFRPQVHFSPRVHWTNDPNGLVYLHGEYHLFFQFNPFGDEWGHMSWGHAVSKDLLHWQELPVAIPEHGDEMVFTGSAVVDPNTSGFCTPKPECLVAIYTGHRHSGKETRQVQNIAFSVDDGRTWTRFSGNPVIDLQMTDFRDPSVSWDEGHKRWVMAVSLPEQHQIRFYSSANLKQWSELSDFGPAEAIGGAWECPDLLRIPAEDGKDAMWALKVGLNPGAPQGGSGEQYFIGSFDGTRFVASQERGAHGWTNYGKDDYCAISFNGLPTGEKPVLIGWMNNWQYAAKLPTSPWRGQMSIPRRLSFMRDEAGFALKQEPVTVGLQEKPIELRPEKIFKDGQTAVAPFEVQADFGERKVGAFGIRLYTAEHHWTEIGFDPVKRALYVDRTKSGTMVAPDFESRTTAPLVASRPMNLRIIVDRSSVEVFAQDGTIAMTNLIFPSSPQNKVVFFSDHPPNGVKAKLWQLKSIWK